MTENRIASSLKTWFLGGVLPLAIILTGVGAFLAMGKSQPKQVVQDEGPSATLMALPIVKVEAGSLLAKNAPIDIDATGVVVPFRQVAIASEVAGRVVYKSENCRIGRYVDEGEVLFRMDPTDYQMEVERLSAMRDSEYAQQKELDQEMANAQRLLEFANQEVDLQDREIKRLEQLPSGFASETELDQARRGLLNASNQRLTIQNQLELLATRRTRILLAERLAATQLAMAKVNLARTEVKAPIAGVVVEEMVEQASFIQKGANLCVIDDTQHVEVSCNLRSDQLMLILEQHQQDPSDTAVDANGDQSRSYELPATPVTVAFRVAGREENVFEWRGTLSRYEGIGLDPKSRTIPVRIVVDNPREVTLNGKPLDVKKTPGPAALVQGMFIDCRIHTTPRRKLMLIPKLALRPGNEIWVFEPRDEAEESDARSDVGYQEMLKEWVPGKVRLVDGIRPVRTLRQPADSSKEYWVVDARDDIDPNAMFVVSPIAGFKGDGSDQVRYRVQ